MTESEKQNIQEIQYIFSDMDNTLFDFVHAKVEACTAVVNRIGTGEPLEMMSYFLRGIYGFENLENIEDYLREKYVFSDSLFEECCCIYEDVKVENVELYDGVRETIEAVKDMGRAFVIVTDADTENAYRRMKRVKLDGLVDDVIAYDMSGKKKPDLGAFDFALKRTGASAAESMYIGDSLRRDIAPAKKMGMVTAYAAYGDRNDHDRDFYFEPDYKLNHLGEIIDIIQNNPKTPVSSKKDSEKAAASEN
ncbi:Phosphoglycolate phosphatase [Methanimicrococcus hongohii]|uniref:Phosphoglycolate phosphatase n=1 Tax=Methanimicrococcus hongohii TaxID=3028295 RepID=A0AA96V8A7_9EURY|nr:HAD family hydrolase [Methanimicrococcus sp. Hf6]WNY23326.1 Phosphoglycolate phosphatase [Methanimicrococcus sp. Hf6]